MKEYDLIIVFGVQEMMKELAVKIKDEMKPNTLIVSCRFPIASYKSVFNIDDELLQQKKLMDLDIVARKII